MLFHICPISPGPRPATSNPYVHEESLVGFPESTVLWVTRTGPSVGIAPLSLDLGVHAAGSPSLGDEGISITISLTGKLKTSIYACIFTWRKHA